MFVTPARNPGTVGCYENILYDEFDRSIQEYEMSMVYAAQNPPDGKLPCWVPSIWVSSEVIDSCSIMLQSYLQSQSVTDYDVTQMSDTSFSERGDDITSGTVSKPN